MPLSKAQIKFIQSLHQKKYRQMYGKFLVEGDKTVRELLASSLKVDSIYAVSGWKSENHISPTVNVNEVTENELRQLSTQENPDEVVAIAILPEAIDGSSIENELCLVCDTLNDPGNAGSIIRMADWFGIQQIFFSENSVDVYNPKVVSAAKGSLFRMNIQYVDLVKLFSENKQLPVFGTFMAGENIYESDLPSHGFILIGNEANGISADLLPYISRKISIPSFGGAESLNVAVAAAIVVSEFKRRK